MTTRLRASNRRYHSLTARHHAVWWRKARYCRSMTRANTCDVSPTPGCMEIFKWSAPRNSSQEKQVIIAWGHI